MTTREQFKRKVISAIHDLPYEEALRKELYPNDKKYNTNCLVKIIGEDRYEEVLRAGDFIKKYTETSWADCHDKKISNWKYEYKVIGMPITIGRVMAALQRVEDFIRCDIKIRPYYMNKLQFEVDGVLAAKWKLTKENGIECTDDDQTDEDIEALLKLFN